MTEAEFKAWAEEQARKYQRGTLWGDLAAAVLDLIAERDGLRRWRCEQDCRFTMGDVADVAGVHCPPDRPCWRCVARRALEAAEAKLAEAEREAERRFDCRRGPGWSSNGPPCGVCATCLLAKLARAERERDSYIAQVTNETIRQAHAKEAEAEARALRERVETLTDRLERLVGSLVAAADHGQEQILARGVGTQILAILSGAWEGPDCAPIRCTRERAALAAGKEGL